jgi:hypothetical protein
MTYNLLNSSIQAAKSPSSPIVINYRAQDIFDVFARILDTSLDKALAQTHMTTELIDVISNIITRNSLVGKKTKLEYESFRNFIAVPLYLINALRISPFEVQDLPENLHIRGYFAKDESRVVEPLNTLITFAVLTGLTQLWCIIVFVYCVSRGGNRPGVSNYLELDSATKSTFAGMGLGNSLSGDIIRKFSTASILLRVGGDGGSDFHVAS